MGATNLETVRRACEAWGTGDISIYREMYAGEVTADAGRFAPETPNGVLRGPDEIMAAFDSLMKTFDSSELLLDGFVEQADRLVVTVLMRAVPKGSSVTVDWPLAIAYRFHDGKIVHQAWFPTLDEALDVAGLARDTKLERVAGSEPS